MNVQDVLIAVDLLVSGRVISLTALSDSISRWQKVRSIKHKIGEGGEGGRKKSEKFALFGKQEVGGSVRTKRANSFPEKVFFRFIPENSSEILFPIICVTCCVRSLHYRSGNISAAADNTGANKNIGTGVILTKCCKYKHRYKYR